MEGKQKPPIVFLILIPHRCLKNIVRIMTAQLIFLLEGEERSPVIGFDFPNGSYIHSLIGKLMKKFVFNNGF